MNYQLYCKILSCLCGTTIIFDCKIFIRHFVNIPLTLNDSDIGEFHPEFPSLSTGLQARDSNWNIKTFWLQMFQFQLFNGKY